jgi:VanZ family protein
MIAMLDEMHTKKSLNTQLFSLIILFLWGISISMVCYLSIVPRVEFPVDFRWADVVYHFCAYLWLSFLPFIGFRSLQSAWISALLMIPLGIGLEFGQHFVPARVFSIMDIAANSYGALAGIVCGLYLRSMFLNKRG